MEKAADIFALCEFVGEGDIVGRVNVVHRSGLHPLLGVLGNIGRLGAGKGEGGGREGGGR